MNNTMKAIVVAVVAFVILIAVTRPPTLSMTLRPDPKDQQKLGIGLSLRRTFGSTTHDRNGKPLRANVRITTPDGKVVGEATDLLGNFAVG